MTEIRQPFGPGVGEQPGIGSPAPVPGASSENEPAVSETALAPSTIRPQAPAGVGSPEWWDSQQIDPMRANRIMADDALGSPGQLPTFEWAMARVNPRNLTAQDPRFPLPIEQLGPMDLPKKSDLHSLNINFDFIDSRTSFNEVGAHVGNETLGDDIFQFFNARDIDWIEWGIPSRVMDYGVAFPLAVLGAPFGDNSIPNQILDALGQAEDEDQWWQFQQTEAYWEWLATAGPKGEDGVGTPATEEQMRQQAYQMSRETWGGNRNVMAMEALTRQMVIDRKKLAGLSSGSDRFDWMAKASLINDWSGLDEIMPDASELEREAEADRMIAEMWARDPGLTQDKATVREWLLKGPGPADEGGTNARPYNMVDHFIQSVGGYPAYLLPIVGAELAEWIAPTDRFAEAYWAVSTQEQRTGKLGQVTLAATGSDIAVAAAAAWVGVPWLAAGRLAGATVPAKAAWQTYQVSMKVAKASLIVGMTSMAASLSLSWANPQYAATIGRRVDMARPVSNSFVHPLVNAVGIVTSGTMGVIPSLQVGKHIVSKAGRAARVATVTGKWEPTGVQQFFGGAASRTSRTFDGPLGFNPQTQQNAMTATMSSYIANLDLKAQTKLIINALNGVETGTELDLLVGAAKLKRIEQIMKTWDPQQAAQVGWQTIGIREAQPSLWTKLFDDPAMQLYKAARKASRTLDNDVAQTMIRDYAGYHGGTVEAIQTSIVGRLRRIQTNFPGAMSARTDVDDVVRSIGGRVGDDVEELQRAANRAHSIEFYLENGEMTAAAQGSEEAARIHLIRVRTITQEDVTPELLVILRGGDDASQAAKETLRQTKDEVSRALAGKDMTPDELAQFLEDMRPGYAIKRQLPDPQAATANDPLNVYHRRLVDDGEWDIGFIPYVDEAIPLARNTIMPVLPDGSLNVGVKGPVEALTSPPEGWRKIIPGEVFDPSRKFKPTVGDGTYVNEIVGEVFRPVTNPGQFTANTTVRIIHEPSVAGISKSIRDTMSWGAWFDGNGAVLTSPVDNALVPVLDDAGQPLLLHGQNFGADWPVLIAEDGSEWVFKAFRGKGGPENLVTLGEGAIETETRLGRLYSMVGLEGATTMPHTRAGVKGTIQPYYRDLQPIGMKNMAEAWPLLSRQQQEDAMGHYMMDWLFSQHDTNATSLFINPQGKVIGVDKGQALKFYNQGDWPPRLDFDPNGFGDTFGVYLKKAGIEADRGLIEDVLQKIESIPAETFDQEMLRIGNARKLDDVGDVMKAWDRDPVVFAKEMADRRMSLRQVMNDLFENELGSAGIPHPEAAVKFYKAGRPLSYGPSFGGASFQNKRFQLKMLQDEADAAPFVDPPTPDGGIQRSGVIIAEEDGTIWLAEPLDKFDGYQAQTIKGNVEPGESLRAAAVREAREETGFDIALDSHLIDYVDPQTGETIRYYNATRIGGSPSLVAKNIDTGGGVMQSETAQLINAKPRDLEALVKAGTKQTGIDRDMAVMEAYLQTKSTGTLRHQIDDAAAGAIGNAGEELASMPGVTATTARRYVSYQRLGSGEYIRVPWIDQVLTAPGPQALGNRTFLGGKLDAVFRGFRTWRIAETQKANLFRRMARDYVGVTNHQVEAFTRELEEIAVRHHVPVQFIGNMNQHVMQTIPLAGQAVREATIEAATKVFGKNLVNAQTGAVVPIRSVPWRDIITKSHRQAFKHNLTAGFTSYIYSLPGGWAPALVGQGIWPMLKFSLSPIFKISEYAESGVLNRMRGVTNLPDDIIELYAPHMGFSRSQIAGEQGLSPMINGMGFVRYRGPGAASNNGIAFSLPGQRARTATGLRTWEDVLTMAPEAPNVSTDGVATFLGSDPLTAPAATYPRTLPDYTPQAMMPRSVNAEGKIMVNPEVAEWDAARLADSQRQAMSWERFLTSEADIEQALYGLAILRELGYERIDKLITSMPIFHSPGDDWLRVLDFGDAGYAHGPRPTRMETGALKAEATPEQTLRWFGDEGAMGDAERAQLLTLQGGQAKYATMGSRSGISGGDATIVLKHDVLKRALITDSDRIGAGFQYSGSGMSAQGLFTNQRHQLLSNISNMRPGDDLASALKSGAYHNELAIYDAPAWAEVDAIMFSNKNAMDDFVTKLDAAPQEVKDALAHVELREVDAPFGSNNSWSKIADDYMWEKSGLSEMRDVTPVMARDDTLLQLINPDQISPSIGRSMLTGVKERANAAGWEIIHPPSTTYGRASVMDDLAKQIELIDADIERAAGEATAESLRAGKTGAAQEELAMRQARMHEAEKLYDDLETLRKNGRLQHTTARDARLTQQKILKAQADPDGNIEAFAEARTVWASGGSEDDLLRFIRESPDLDLSVTERSTFANAVHDEVVISEFTERYVALKYSGHPAPRNSGIHEWEIFGGKLEVKNLGSGEARAINAEPIPLGQANWEARRDWVDARATQKVLGPDLPANYQRSPTAFPGSIRPEIVPEEFASRIQSEATARLGYDPGSPVVDVYVRGTRAGIKDGAEAGATEIVIVVKAPDKGSIGLTLKEIEDIWFETGLPANKIGRHDLYGQIGWDDVNKQILMGDIDALQSVGIDGTTYINGGGLKGTPVIFTDSFEHGGQAYRSLAGFSDGYFDPSLVRQTSHGKNQMQLREYVTADHSWKWDYQTDINYINASSPVEGRIQKDGLSDQRFRDIWDFLRGDGSSQSWTMDVNVGDTVTLASLKRAWYLDEIPENVVMKSMDQPQQILDNAWFQKKFGASDGIDKLKMPRGLEDIPGTPENVNALFNKKMAEKLGVDEAALLAGDFDAIAAQTATGENEGLLELLRNFMDPIPYKEGAMSRQVITEMNEIFVGVLKETDHPALKVFREIGIVDEDISTFLLRDRELLEKWLLHGRDMDLDRLLAHASKDGDPSLARDMLDDLYSSSEYNTMTQMWRLSLKAAQDEAFGVHFFNPYRSVLERSLNHPVFGVYPLSWSLKAAREWARFLFDNRMLQAGKIRLGMAPAVAINEYNRKLNVFAAKQGMDVGELLSIWGPLGNQMMIAGLLMPGDWSSIPFPTSRTIRDVTRGDINPSNLWNDNMVGGITRDIRLGVGTAFEMRDVLARVLPEDTWPFSESPPPKAPRQNPVVRGNEINYTEP